ncbi:MAG: hypothetical protein IJK62_01330 [Bacteroidales bacterium]|nr:hypothetical protein [Bacteroidales bacterium]
MVKNFEEFLRESYGGEVSESLILEHRNDLKPIICIIIGGPGAGKTYWMQHQADAFLWQQFKQLDIDHTLKKYQLETCNEVAVKLITSLSDYGVHVNQTKRKFDEVKQKIQSVLNERTDKVGSFGMYIDITGIGLDSKIGKSTLWEWAKRMDKITKRERFDEFMNSFKSEFYKTYFKDIFAGDFSRRDMASEEYDRNLRKKLDNNIEDNNNSTCIAITGKSKGDIEWIVSELKHTKSVVSVVYIDTPVENAIEQDRRRDRKVGEEFIRNTMEQISNTWEILKQDFENMGIWKMFHLKPIYDERGTVKPDMMNDEKVQYEVCEVFTNKTMLYR